MTISAHLSRDESAVGRNLQILSLPRACYQPSGSDPDADPDPHSPSPALRPTQAGPGRPRTGAIGRSLSVTANFRRQILQRMTFALRRDYSVGKWPREVGGRARLQARPGTSAPQRQHVLRPKSQNSRSHDGQINAGLFVSDVYSWATCPQWCPASDHFPERYIFW